MNVNKGDVVTVQLSINMAFDSATPLKVLAVDVDYKIAVIYDPNIDAIHLANLPVLEPDTPEDPAHLDYIILESVESGDTYALAKVWVRDYEVSNTLNYTLEINGISTNEYQGLVKILNNYGLGGKFKLTNRTIN